MANAKQSSSSHMLKTGKRGNPFCKVSVHPRTGARTGQKAINALAPGRISVERWRIDVVVHANIPYVVCRTPTTCSQPSSSRLIWATIPASSAPIPTLSPQTMQHKTYLPYVSPNRIARATQMIHSESSPPPLQPHSQ